MGACCAKVSLASQDTGKFASVAPAEMELAPANPKSESKPALLTHLSMTDFGADPSLAIKKKFELLHTDFVDIPPLRTLLQSGDVALVKASYLLELAGQLTHVAKEGVPAGDTRSAGGAGGGGLRLGRRRRICCCLRLLHLLLLLLRLRLWQGRPHPTEDFTKLLGATRWRELR